MLTWSSSSSSSRSSSCPAVALARASGSLQQAIFGVVGLTNPTGGGGGVAYFAHIGGFVVRPARRSGCSRRRARPMAGRRYPVVLMRRRDPRGGAVLRRALCSCSPCTRRSRRGLDVLTVLSVARARPVRVRHRRRPAASSGPSEGRARSLPRGRRRSPAAARRPAARSRPRRASRGAPRSAAPAPLQPANGPVARGRPAPARCGFRPDDARADRGAHSASSSRRAAGLLFDLDTGKVLWARSPTRVLPIASLTKMMTALLVGRPRAARRARCSSPRQALAYTGSGVGVLPRGQARPLETMLYGLLLPSGNDAAIALAQRVGRHRPAFVALMNERGRARSACAARTSPRPAASTTAATTRAPPTSPSWRAPCSPSRAWRASCARRGASLPFPIKGGKLYLSNNNPLLRTGYPGTIGREDRLHRRRRPLPGRRRAARGAAWASCCCTRPTPARRPGSCSTAASRPSPERRGSRVRARRVPTRRHRGGQSGSPEPTRPRKGDPTCPTRRASARWPSSPSSAACSPRPEAICTTTDGARAAGTRVVAVWPAAASRRRHRPPGPPGRAPASSRGRAARRRSSSAAGRGRSRAGRSRGRAA